MNKNRIIILLFMIFSLTSCVTERKMQSADQKDEIPTTLLPTQLNIDVTIYPERVHQRTIDLNQGDIIYIAQPSLAPEWHIEYSSRLFKPLSVVSEKKGWGFQAISSGDGSFSLTSIVKCDSPTPCQLMPARLEFLVRVQ